VAPTSDTKASRDPSGDQIGLLNFTPRSRFDVTGIVGVPSTNAVQILATSPWLAQYVMRPLSGDQAQTLERAVLKGGLSRYGLRRMLLAGSGCSSPPAALIVQRLCVSPAMRRKPISSPLGDHWASKVSAARRIGRPLSVSGLMNSRLFHGFQLNRSPRMAW